MIRLGVVNPETWDFFQELFEYFGSRFQTSLFERRPVRLPVLRTRAERYLLRRDLNRFLRQNDVVFFEWASDLLALASHLPKSARIITRLHRWELYAWADAVNWDAVDRIILVSEAKRREFANGSRVSGTRSKSFRNRSIWSASPTSNGARPEHWAHCVTCGQGSGFTI